MNYAVTQRLRLIDFLIKHYGTLNRSALEDYFGISTPQASVDLQQYIKLCPGNIEYDKSAKVYRRSATFNPHFK